MKTASIIMLVAGAAALGAAFGLVMAPNKGAETVESVKDFLRSHVPVVKKQRLQALAQQIQKL